MKHLFLIPTVVLIVAGPLKAQSTYKLDAGHTLVEFNVERFMVGEVTGKFKVFEGEVELGEDGTLTTASLQIESISLDTDHEVRDGHLRSAIWLDTENHPKITFVSTRVFEEEGRQYLEGNLTIKGSTRPIQLAFDMKGPFEDPTGATTIGLVSDLVIDRQNYGISFSKLMDNGELFIGNEVRIRIRALAIAN